MGNKLNYNIFDERLRKPDQLLRDGARAESLRCSGAEFDTVDTKDEAGNPVAAENCAINVYIGRESRIFQLPVKYIDNLTGDKEVENRLKQGISSFYREKFKS